MPTTRLLFSTTDHLFSAGIRLCTWSEWSHVGLVDGDTVIEATALHGVVRSPLPAAIGRAARWEFVDLPCTDPDAILSAAASQIGKPYDFGAVVGIGFRRNWQQDDRWFCSELVAWSFDRAGEPLFRAGALHRVTQQHLWMLAPNALIPAGGQCQILR